MSENANFITLVVSIYFEGKLFSFHFKFLREWFVS